MKTTGAAAIKHVVLLLMENRPFDHFFGFAQPFLPNKIDGLTGKECFPTRQASAMPTPLATAAPTHPLDGLTKIMYNTFGHEDKFVSFASTATPPGETGPKHWLRATYTNVKDAMPTRFEAVAATPYAYKLYNAWPKDEGYLCAVKETGGSYMFLHSSCNASDAIVLTVKPNALGDYTMQDSSTKLYLSFCDSGCSGGKWLATSYKDPHDAMTVTLSDPGVVPPPPPPGPPECVQNGTANYVCKHDGSWLGRPPLGWNSSWDGFNPICPNGLPKLCPTGKCPRLCTNGLGNVGRNMSCKWPLTYQGKVYDGTDGCAGGDTHGGYGFCSPYGGEYNGTYGGCKLCDDSHFWDGCEEFPKTNQGGWMLSGMDKEVIHQFSPNEIPVKMKLAQEFALFDQYHTSFPGPSTPNHLYLMTGTNAGCTSTGEDFMCTKGMKYPQKTIFQSLQDAGHDWRYYYNDSAWNFFVEWFSTPEGAAGVVGYDEFYDRASKGTLPAYSWVLPRQGTNKTSGDGPNDDHPCHDVRLGERLLKDTYEAVRAGPGWNNTLMFVTYDDTGGWYDHADLPTQGIPRPDDKYGTCGAAMDMNWVGMRAPALLISPWVSKGKVISHPDGPTNTSLYEHSSLLSALKTIFDLPSYLTKRDEWAGDLSKELDLKAPRTDCPMHLPAAPTNADTLVDALATHGGVDPSVELTRRQARRVMGLARAIGVEPPDVRAMSHEAAEAWIAEAEARHRKMARRDEL